MPTFEEGSILLAHFGLCYGC